jgi:thiol-disulfide isomerase/thioredoxin
MKLIYTAGVDAAYEAYTKATESEERDKLWNAYVLANDSIITKILEDVRQAPSSPMAYDLLLWVVTNHRIHARALWPCRLQAAECLRDHHTVNPNIGPVCRVLGHNWDPLDQAAIDFLRAAATKNPDRSARGYATFALAQLTKQKAEEMIFWEIVPASIYTHAAAQKDRAAWAAESKKADSRTLFQQAERLFETVTKQYADCPNFPAGPGLRHPKPTLGDQADIELYECRHLELGKAAPEIQGDDLDGQKLTLTEYRGKVVVLSFWASWCGPCMQMVPHERAMAQRLVGKPFALVGVNGDADRADAKRAAARENLTWRSFWNDEGSDSGIRAAWNVHGWPTVYVLDFKGTIRLKLQGYGGKNSDALLDNVVDRLLQEVEAGK